MRVLVTGAYGFIGSHVVAGLLEAGHDVVGCGRDLTRGRRRFPDVDWLACDFNRDVTPTHWAPRLAGVDAVVNCAGILQASRRQSMDAIHRAAPCALFDACAEVGVRRVVQISALGADAAAGTEYAASKEAAETRLAALDLDWVILRPSLVYASGSYGGTSLLRGLAAFPCVVPLPGGGEYRFQPLHMDDLVRAIRWFLDADTPTKVRLDAVGPEPMTLRDIVLGLREWLGLAPAPVVRVPLRLVMALARCGDLLGYLSGRGTLRSTALRQMAYGNTADPAAFEAAVGFRPRSFGRALQLEPSHVQDRWHARLYFLKPLLRLALAVCWIAAGWLALSAVPDIAWAGFLAGPALPSVAVPWTGRVLAVIALALGAALLLRWRVRLVAAAQLVVTLAVVVALLLARHNDWAGVIGLSVAVPVMAATLAMMAIEDER